MSNVQKVGAVILLVLSVVQLAAVWVICDSATIMRGEWAMQCKQYLQGVDGKVVRSRPLWGPVRVFLMTHCQRVQHVDRMITKFTKDNGVDHGYCYARKSHGDGMYWNIGGYAAAQSADGHLGNLDVAPGEFVTDDSKNSTYVAVNDPMNRTVADTQKANWGHLLGLDSPNLLSFDLPCNTGRIYFGGVRLLDRYLSLVTFTRTMSDLFGVHRNDPVDYREHCFRYLRLYVIVCLLIKYVSKCVQTLQHSRWFGSIRNTRSMFDRHLESTLLHGMTSLFCISLQVSLCTCFLVVYRQDHAFLTYVPMFAFDCYFWSFVVVALLNELDKHMEWSKQRCTYWKNCLFWWAWALFMIVLAIPLIGTAVYNVQFLWLVGRCRWAEEDLEIISPTFYGAAWKGSLACWVCIVQAVLEQLLYSVLDCYTDNKSKAPVAKEIIQSPYDILEAF